MRAEELKKSKVNNVESKKTVHELYEDILDKMHRVQRLLDKKLEENNVVVGMIESLADFSEDMYTTILHEHQLMENSIQDFDIDVIREKLNLYISENVDIDLDKDLSSLSSIGKSGNSLNKAASRGKKQVKKNKRELNPLPPRTVTEGLGINLGDLIKVSTGVRSDCDFYIVRRGDSEKVGMPTKEPIEHGYCIRVKRKDILDPNHLFYMLKYLHSSGYFKRLATGSTNLTNIRASDIKNIKVSENGMLHESVLDVIKETVSGSIATAMVAPKDKKNTGTLFGGTYTQESSDDDADNDDGSKKPKNTVIKR